jgi:hypothetical protein
MAEQEILAPVAYNSYFFQKALCTWPFLTAADRKSALSSPLPYQVWHGYGVSSAHHGEVMGCQRACERTPLRGRRRCAAGVKLTMISIVALSPLQIWVLLVFAKVICDALEAIP